MNKERILFVGVGSRSEEMVALLERRRYAVFHVPDAEQALEAAQIQRFGLIVCDPSIPSDGLRELSHRPEACWLVELHDSDEEPSLERRGNGASTEAVIAGLGNLDHVTDLLDRLLVQPGAFAPPPGKNKPHEEDAATPFLDADLFARQMSHDSATMREIVSLYITETAHQLWALERLIALHDLAGARRLAHTLKGSFGAVFACRARELSRQIELALASHDVALAAALLIPLKEAALGAEKALTQFL